MESVDNTRTDSATQNADAPATPSAPAAPAADALAELGVDIMKECRNSLMMRFLYLDVALWRIELIADPGADRLMTDGNELHFDPRDTALRYRENPNVVTRDLLHALLHCIFRHPFDDRTENVRIYSIVCDIIAESLALDICGQEFAVPFDDRKRRVLASLQKELPTLIPAKLYRYLLDNVDDESLQGLEALFARDSHAPWACNAERSWRSERAKPKRADEPRPKDKLKRLGALSDESDDDDKGSGSFPDPFDEAPANSKMKSGEAANGADGDDDGEAPPGEGDGKGAAVPGDGVPDIPETPEDLLDEEALEQVKQDWEEISKQIEVDLETRSQSWGKDAANLAQTLSLANRKRYDYEDFLRKFAIVGEDIRLNDDEFDYIYYTFGIDTYGDMPLIEPLEYKEDSRTRDFCIAIDTSGSCSGDLVRTFVQRTYDILRNTESFGDKVNIHIIECDARVQMDTKITDLRGLEDYLSEFTVHGFGGTDFRPVFDYVDQLIADGEFDDMRGLIYFTDGLGTYPTRRPDYETAFVFVSDTIVDVKIPPWAMKVMLDEETVRSM